MEQQPGPVNWAAYNPAPHPGAVRLWTFEAIAHGAEVVSYLLATSAFCSGTDALRVESARSTT
jgi:beta-galactosidase GanA